jgi:peptidoglycan/LPS O-acetylase OafA/YrhL
MAFRRLRLFFSVLSLVARRNVISVWLSNRLLPPASIGDEVAREPAIRMKPFDGAGISTVATTRSSGRNKTLDGARGCLALVVLLWHVSSQTSGILLAASQGAVFGFFILSALVLTRAWDGHTPAFLCRRFVRLWPMYALCLGAGYILARRQPQWSEFFWFPLMNPNDPTLVDLPAWSLCIEAWAMLAMPLFVRFRGKPLVWVFAAAMAGCLFRNAFDALPFFAVFFVVGAWLSSFEIRWSPLEHWAPQWLGRISYPLYLSHWLVLRYCPGPIVGRAALAFLVAQLLAWTVERWSIDASRQITRNRRRLPEPSAG